MIKQILLASCVLGLATSVAAADITNPFYLPEKGQMGSITSAGFDKFQEKNETGYSRKEYSTLVNEELQYGLTNTLTLIGSLGNAFNREKMMNGKAHTTDENINWSAGLAWNILDKTFKLQLKALYLQDRLYNLKGEYKSVMGEVKLGYQFKKFLPYVSAGEELPIAQAKGADKPIYNAKVGLYQGQCGIWALDTGIRWMHSENGEYNAYTAEAEASYYLTQNTTVGVYGTYTFDGTAKYDADVYDKSIGVRLRWFF